MKYKQETNEERLYQYILKNADSREFLIQKSNRLGIAGILENKR